VSVLRALHGEDFGSVADDSKAHTASIFRVEVCIVNQCPCVFIMQ
jgi:hypothetical protein